MRITKVDKPERYFKKEMKVKVFIALIIGYVALYPAIFTPRMYEYTWRGDPRENWAIAKPALRWVKFPYTLRSLSHKISGFNKAIIYVYTPMVIIDIKIKGSKFLWKYGQPAPAWTKEYF